MNVRARALFANFCCSVCATKIVATSYIPRDSCKSDCPAAFAYERACVRARELSLQVLAVCTSVGCVCVCVCVCACVCVYVCVTERESERERESCVHKLQVGSLFCCCVRKLKGVGICVFMCVRVRGVCVCLRETHIHKVQVGALLC